MTLNVINEKEKTFKDESFIPKSQKRLRSGSFYDGKTFHVKRKNYVEKRSKRKINICDLSEEVLFEILIHVTADELLYTSETCWKLYEICNSEYLWKHRCKNDFKLETKWAKYSYRYLYEMIFKSKVVCNYLTPLSHLKSLIVWYLIDPHAPCKNAECLTVNNAKLIWGITQKEYIDKTNISTYRDIVNNTCSWRRLHNALLEKYGGIIPMQNYVLRRCLRLRKTLDRRFNYFLNECQRFHCCYRTLYLGDGNIGWIR
ncbi:uncharacterized protein LOC101238866 isoform X1 [Hydra vulgaris]|uniref:uncharacterized protein LOC101238866 isoform X1 n=1 Tax=Hydra vulgaris TaxID=6087 RepID=UPI0002B4D90D|nr:uncharacterized protein LOC101238866 [Hydra vulgaris]